MNDLNLTATLPALSLALGACVLFFVDLFVPKERKYLTAALAVAGTVVSFILSLMQFNTNTTAFRGMYIADTFTALVNIIASITAALSVLIAYNYLQRTNNDRGEYYPLLLISTSGAMFMGSAGDLTMVFVALEMLSIPLYILSGFRRNNSRSEESAMKYFLLGVFATGFLVYGIALIYGATGTTNLSAIFERVRVDEVVSPFLLLAGTGLVLVGLGFKIAAVPFHMWTPDVYQGAPTSVTAFMSVMAKVGGFTALLRVLTIAIPIFVVTTVPADATGTLQLHTVWQDILALMAAATMILGNFVALQQKDVKRLLAYSSIANAGYILMAVAASGTFSVAIDAAGTRTVNLALATDALQAVLMYLIVYAFTNLGAFAVVTAVEKDDATTVMLDDLSGLGRAKPLIALAMSVFMLSLTGIPLTGGFVGKWFVFRSALNSGLWGLALIGVLTSVVSAYYYLRVIVKMWFENGEADAIVDLPMLSAVGITAVGTIVLGVLPLVVNIVQNVTATVAMR